MWIPLGSWQNPFSHGGAGHGKPLAASRTYLLWLWLTTDVCKSKPLSKKGCARNDAISQIREKLSGDEIVAGLLLCHNYTCRLESQRLPAVLFSCTNTNNYDQADYMNYSRCRLKDASRSPTKLWRSRAGLNLERKEFLRKRVFNGTRGQTMMKHLAPGSRQWVTDEASNRAKVCSVLLKQHDRGYRSDQESDVTTDEQSTGGHATTLPNCHATAAKGRTTSFLSRFNNLAMASTLQLQVSCAKYSVPRPIQSTASIN